MGEKRKTIIVIGATGTIGSAVARLLSEDHDVIPMSRSSEHSIDIASEDSIEAALRRVGSFDALICASGKAKTGSINGLQAQDYVYTFENKVLPQINLVRIGSRYVRPGGSFTLTSGYLSKEPIAGFSSVSLTNGAIDSFVKAAAAELQNDARLNCVSPCFMKESLEKAGITDWSAFSVHSAMATARAYKAAVEGDFTGKDLDCRLYC